jgi:hypothetical protein
MLSLNLCFKLRPSRITWVSWHYLYWLWTGVLWMRECSECEWGSGCGLVSSEWGSAVFVAEIHLYVTAICCFCLSFFSTAIFLFVFFSTTIFLFVFSQQLYSCLFLFSTAIFMFVFS